MVSSEAGLGIVSYCLQADDSVKTDSHQNGQIGQLSANLPILLPIIIIEQADILLLFASLKVLVIRGV